MTTNTNNTTNNEITAVQNQNTNGEMNMTNTINVTIEGKEVTVAVEVNALKGLKNEVLEAIIRDLMDNGYKARLRSIKGNKKNKMEMVREIMNVLTTEQTIGKVEVTFADGTTDAQSIEADVVDQEEIMQINDQKLVVDITNKMVTKGHVSIQEFTVLDRTTVPGVGQASLRYAEIEEPQTGLIMAKGGLVSVENKVSNFISIEFGRGGEKYGKRLAERGGFVAIDTDGNYKLFMKRVDLNGKLTGYRELVAHVDYSLDQLPEGAIAIRSFGASPAAARKNTFIFATSNIWNKIAPALNRWYNGAYGLVLEGKLGGAKQASDSLTRMQQRMTDQVKFGSVETIAIFNGKLADGAIDGTEYLNLYSIKAWLEQEFSYFLGKQVFVTTDAIKGLPFQSRVATNKSQSKVKLPSMINAMISHLEANGTKIVVAYRPDLTAERSLQLLQERDTLLIATNDPNFEFGVSQIDILTDENTKKLHFDLSADMPFWLLKAIKVKNVATLSDQVMSKIMHEPGGMELIREIMTEDITKDLQGFKESAAAGRMVSEKELASSDVTGVASKLLVDDALKHVPFIERNIIVSQWKELYKKASSLRAEVHGAYLTAEIDVTSLFYRDGILAPNEIYVKDANAERALLIKFPSVHFREYLLANIVTLQQIEERVNELADAGHITDSEAIQIIKDYHMQSTATIVVSSYDVLKSLLAGFDTDTDALMAFYDERIIKVIEQAKPLAVIIESADSLNTRKDYDLSIDGSGETISRMLDVVGMSIGQSTLIGGMFASLLALREEQALAALQFMFGRFGEEKYEGLRRDAIKGFEAVHVKEADAVRVIESLPNVAFTANNLRQIIEDLVAITRYLQETTIDAPKTSVRSAIELDLKIDGKAASSKWHMTSELPRLDENGKLTYEFKEGNRFYLPNPLHDLRVELIETVRESLQARIDNLAPLSSIMGEQLESAIPSELRYALIGWTSSYKAIQGAYVQQIQPTLNEETGEFVAVSEDKMKAYRNVRKGKIQMLVNSIRMSTVHMSVLERGMMMLAASLLDNQNNIRRDMGNGFYTIMPLELYSVLSHFSQSFNKEAGYVGTEITIIEKFNKVTDADGNEDFIVKGGSMIQFDDAGSVISHYGMDKKGNKQAVVLPNLELEGVYRVVERGGKFIAMKPMSQVLNEITEDMHIEYQNMDEFQVFVNYYEDKAKVNEQIKNAKRLIVTANSKHGDFLRLEDGTPVASITLPKGVDGVQNHMAGALDGRIFDVAFVDFKEDNGFQNLIIGLKGGIYVGGTFPRPKQRFVFEREDIKVNKANQNNTQPTKKDDDDDMQAMLSLLM